MFKHMYVCDGAAHLIFAQRDAPEFVAFASHSFSMTYLSKGEEEK